jgi:hypothetical protein
MIIINKNMGSQYWFEYVKTCYDLVIESEGFNDLILDNDIEAYVVHLMARNFQRTDIGEIAIALKMLEAVNSNERSNLLSVADECLLIHSYPFKRSRWPTKTYYIDMGTTAYGLAGHVMEQHFMPASRVLSAIFGRTSLGNTANISYN